jgi:hypothetical protein
MAPSESTAFVSPPESFESLLAEPSLSVAGSSPVPLLWLAMSDLLVLALALALGLALGLALALALDLVRPSSCGHEPLATPTPVRPSGVKSEQQGGFKQPDLFLASAFDFKHRDIASQAKCLRA